MSRGPQRICVPANAGEAEILPMISRVSDDVGRVEAPPGAARVEGMEEGVSIGRRAFSRDMLRALGVSVSRRT